MNKVAVIGLALAGLATIAVVGAGSKPTKSGPDKLPRVVKNAKGYYIPVDERYADWANARLEPGLKGYQQRALNQKSLPPDASPNHDKYTKFIFQGPIGLGYDSQFDEYGRYPGGVSGNPLATFAGIAQIALPYIPGVGTAAAAGLAGAMALGQGKSVKDATLAAARATIPAHLQFAYDIGVGVASGQNVDSAAIQALEKQYPGAVKAYKIGKEYAS